MPLYRGGGRAVLMLRLLCDLHSYKILLGSIQHSTPRFRCKVAAIAKVALSNSTAWRATTADVACFQLLDIELICLQPCVYLFNEFQTHAAILCLVVADRILYRASLSESMKRCMARAEMLKFGRAGRECIQSEHG